jgi:predicted MFS family arabinose efflux permease
MTLGVSVHLVSLLSDAGLSPANAALGITVLGLSLVAGRLFAGPLLDILHGPGVAAGFVILAALGLIILASGGASAWMLYLAVALIGLGIGAEFDFMSFLISRYLGLAVYGRAYGLTYAAFQLGCAIGPVLLGVTFDRTGSYSPALWGLVLLVLVAAVLLVNMPRYPETSTNPDMTGD